MLKIQKIYKNIMPLFVPSRMNKLLIIQLRGGFQLTLEFYVKLVKRSQLILKTNKRF